MTHTVDFLPLPSLLEGLPSSSSTALPPSLLEALAPVVHLHPDEQYFPCSPEWYFDRVSVWSDNKTLVVPSGSVDARSLLAAQAQAPGSTLSLRVDPEADYDEVHPDNPTYAGQRDSLDSVPCYTLVRYDEKADLYYVRYFFFYAYNGGLLPIPVVDEAGFLAHEGDWEYVTAVVGWDGDREEATLHAVAYSGHGYTTHWSTYPDARAVPVADLRPIPVYAALHSHASYPTVGAFDLLNIPAFIRPVIGGFDRTGAGATWTTANHLVPIEPVDGGGYEPAWAAYKGAWGTDIEIDTVLNVLSKSIKVRVGGPTGPIQKNLGQFLFFGAVDTFYEPQRGQKTRTSANFSHWEAPPFGYLTVDVDAPGISSVPVFSIRHDKAGKPDTTWYSFKQDGDSFPVLSDQPGNRGGTGSQKIYVASRSPVPLGVSGDDTYEVGVTWSPTPRRRDRPEHARPEGAVLMTTVTASYRPQHGQSFRCSDNFPGWAPQDGDALYVEVELLEGREVFPSFAIVHDKSGKDKRWYEGVTDGSYFDVNAQNGGAGKQKIYVGTESALPDGVAGSDVYRVNVYRVPRGARR